MVDERHMKGHRALGNLGRDGDVALDAIAQKLDEIEAERGRRSQTARFPSPAAWFDGADGGPAAK
jgi:hypothetical protein